LPKGSLLNYSYAITKKPLGWFMGNEYITALWNCCNQYYEKGLYL